MTLNGPCPTFGVETDTLNKPGVSGLTEGSTKRSYESLILGNK